MEASQDRMIREIVIVGGGTAGWMTAAALSKVLKGRINITVIESDEIGIIGVGEATIPMIQLYNKMVGLDEQEFMRATQATFKLAIEFVDWGRIGDRYMHGFGRFGQDLWTVTFDQYWQRAYQAGKAADLGEYSIARVAAQRGRFMRAAADVQNSPLAEIVHAFHFDASLYAKYLRTLSERQGVRREEGRIIDVALRSSDGFTESLLLADGRRIGGELFIDCSGFRGLLIEQQMHVGYDDWTHWLPCDRAVAVPCASASPLLPYTRSTARSAGWQWRIPLQHRIGNGHVFSSSFMGEDEATAILLANLDGEALAEPRTIRFTTGMRRRQWYRNVLAIGLSGGFMEPLESTAIHLVQSSISRLLQLFPDRGFSPMLSDEYNRQSQFEFERIRDFLILHYHATQRDDSRFWRHCRSMAIPETLQHKIDLYQREGRIVREGAELFAEVGWLQVMHGQGLRARSYHPLANLPAEADVAGYLESVRSVMARCADLMPTHEEFIAKYCQAASRDPVSP